MGGAFEQAKQLFLDGNAHFEAGRLAEAQACFEASLALLPGRASTLVNLAATRIKLGRPDAALAPLDAALAADATDVDAWLQRGAALGELGRHADALACHDRVLALAPDHPVACYRRAMTLGALQRHAESLAAFERLVLLTPDNAEAWLRRAQALQQLERRADALASYERALALDPQLAAAWTNRGGLLKELGRPDEAAAAFRQAIAAGGDAALNGYFLAALTGEAAPNAPPRRYVERLFDDYAPTFDAHLLGALGYRAHRVLVEQLAGVGPPRFRSALDLGCGTGLCGPLVKAVADGVDGVDLSASMLDQARALGVYDRLEQAELVEHLGRTERRHDLVISADVFIYVGALEAVFAGVQRVLEPGGVFALSVEQMADEHGVDFELRPSLRYAHSEHYLSRLAAEVGFDVVRVHAEPIRVDQRQPIAGLYMVLHRPRSQQAAGRPTAGVSAPHDRCEGALAPARRGARSARVPP